MQCNNPRYIGRDGMSASTTLKSAAKYAFQHMGALSFARWVNRAGLRILMYHRFSDRAALARQCAHMREHYQPVSMADVSEWLHAGRSLPPRALAITVDDGYRDFLESGYPVFAEHHIPVTVFLVTDFMDGKSWLWFDRILHAFAQTRISEPAIQMPDGQVVRFNLGSAASRRAAGQQLADMAVAWSAAERLKLVGDLPYMLETQVPDQPPLDCRPLSWDEVRALAASGVEFGAHTKTHPILSSLSSPDQLQDEIAGSKARIEAELDRPVLHFCYPNGKIKDIGSAAVETVRLSGMRTAVTAEPGLNHAHQDAFLLNRIGADPGHEDLYFQRGLAGWRN